MASESVTNIDDVIALSRDFYDDVKAWLKDNTLTEMLEYKAYQNKDVLGPNYRKDQWYYEKLSNFKSKFMGIKGFYIRFRVDKPLRDVIRKIDGEVEYIDNQMKMLDNLLITARTRVKFYEDIMFLISNFTYGNY